MGDVDDLWAQCAESLREQVSENVWSLTLRSLRPVDFVGDKLVLEAPNPIQRNRVNDRYLQLVEDTMTTVVGHTVAVELVVADHEAPQIPEVHLPEAQVAAPSPAVAVRTASSESNESYAARLDPRFTFDAFVSASSNRLPLAAAQTVAETPGKAYNPLFIYGASGLGKTHLLHAIGNYVQDNYSRMRVLYVTTEHFLNDFIDAIRNKTTLTFKRQYRECDVLLIDDIQFIQGREGLQEELFHTYNTLQGAGKQIVLTSDRTPKAIETLEERLRSRLLSGLLTEIDRPDLETRLAILRTKAEYDRIALPDDVAEFIASHVRDNIRELEGAIIRVNAFANLNREPITLDLAKRVLSDLGDETPTITPDAIVTTVAEYYHFTPNEIRGPRRVRPLVTARHVAMFLMRDLLADYSYPMIARIFDDRNHTTVISAVEKIRGQMAERQQLYDQVTQLRRQLKGES
ncbi:MAG TPA: chromosomal replication initiator protein DnaA [Acidimicrobiales bacterium]